MMTGEFLPPYVPFRGTTVQVYIDLRYKVETGSRNHEVVPTPLIASISGSKGGVQRSISILAKANLIAKVKNTKCSLLLLAKGIPEIG
jgi:RIO-like serine/threonine protein kinase